MKILITGANGQLATSLIAHLAPLGAVVALTRQEFDLCHWEESVATLTRLQPDLIVNAAAYTAVDRAEEEQDLAFQINGIAPTRMAEYCQNNHCALIHYSTDYVFNGQQNTPYREQDPTDPINVYGQSKRQGEVGILESNCAALIFRTSWVYSLVGRNFLNTMLKLGLERDELRIIDDQRGSPTYTESIAEATALILSQKPAHQSIVNYLDQYRGIYHMTNQSDTTWYGFAQAIFALRPTRARLTAITTDQYPTPAQRPHMSCLDNSKLKQTFDITLSHWHDALVACLTQSL
ncbi:MAG: dTDP-4-dehydrorhamnose reductase [Betaproteobacteria bacterium]|nr:dTDP-4-dehydrorhamnose reductase [Betaproteobacteria bacterium]